MSGRSKWTASSGRWKSSAGKSAQVREQPRPPEPETPARPMTLAERLPTLSDAELAALQANAKRVSEEAGNKKMDDAAELLPLIAAELSQRTVAKAAASVERKKDFAEKRAAVRARRVATAAAEAEAAAGQEPAEPDPNS